MVDHPTLIFPAGSASVARQVLDKGMVVLGRSQDATVTLHDERVSGMHAVLWCEGGAVWVADLHSTNGTWLNGQTLSTRIALKQDTTLRVGETELLLRIPAPKRPTPANTTTQSLAPGMPYTVTIWYGIDVPDQAQFIDSDGSVRGVVTAERRVAMLFILAQKLLQDRAAGRPPEQQGWCDDDDIGIGVWGRQWWSQKPGRINVLTHRVRRSLEKIGVNSECVEKSGGRLRLWVRHTELTTPASAQ